METETHNCYGCGGSFARQELQYRPSGKGAYRKERYFCPACNEKEKQKNILANSISTFRKSLTSQPGYMSHKRW
ncbi:hypothetical protein ACU4M6_004149 [Raoultella ornithinolytica]|uniref:hypothetical protein n=1 Tax=Raoultella ornithinolytica TaxID=54291 RepID=UPI0028DEC78F|nr:hypothetical protein [Raoultella ornithinolytica]ELM7284699.1 hypothetical protein [Raoultella ornithinolytica]ELO0970705.1 hypothetical protein [Raoultella ornithinolytica]